MDIYFRHGSVRPQQKELMQDIYETARAGGNLLAHAPTGLGKTDAVLGAALTAALEEDLSVFFLTPKISQHRIAVDVVNGIAEKHRLAAKAVDLVGRKHACIDDSILGLDSEGFYHSCEKKRKNNDCPFYCRARGCNRKQEEVAERLFKKMLKKYGTAKTNAEMKRLGMEHRACPYEWMMKLAAESRVVIADYYHLMVPSIRDLLLLKSKKKLERSIVIIDEAHNLGKRVREHLSSTVSNFLFRKMEKEMRQMKAERMEFAEPFSEWAEGMFGEKKERLVSAHDFWGFLDRYEMEREDMATHFLDLGLEYIERTGKKSACLKFSGFLSGWENDETGCVRILRQKEEYFSLSKRFLDASVGTSILNNAAASILMSGTLTPLEMHRDVLGLDPDRTQMRSYHSPFKEENGLNVIGLGHTTRYTRRSPRNYESMANAIDRIIGVTPGGSAVFFPSYKVQNSVLPHMRSGNLLVQKENMVPKETAALLKKFMGGGTLCGVQGGSLAEGVDYCNEEIKTIVIVGIALEEMGVEVDALIDYYEEKFGKGWEYGYIYPAVIKALQAAGRGRRKESDRCAVVYLDERFRWNNYWRVLDNGEMFYATAEPERYVEEFWKP